jgi:hypothetical protein
MTSVSSRPETSATRSPAHDAPVPLSARLRTAAPLLVGAAALLLLVQPYGPFPPRGFIPLISGLAFVAAGALSGRAGSLWGPGIVIAFWGLAPMTTNYFEEFPGMFYLCLGTGLLVVALLGDRLRIDRMSMALPVLFIGGTMFVSSFVGPDRYLTTVLAVLIAAFALWELRPQRHDTPQVHTDRTA